MKKRSKCAWSSFIATKPRSMNNHSRRIEDEILASGQFAKFDDMLIVYNIISRFIFNEEYITFECLRTLKALGDTCRRMRMLTADPLLWEGVDLYRVVATINYAPPSTRKHTPDLEVFRHWARSCQFLSIFNEYDPVAFSLPNVMPNLKYVVRYGDDNSGSVLHNQLAKTKPIVMHFNVRLGCDAEWRGASDVDLSVSTTHDSKLALWLTAVSKTLPVRGLSDVSFRMTGEGIAALVTAMRCCSGVPTLECLASSVIGESLRSNVIGDAYSAYCVREIQLGMASPNVTPAFLLVAIKVLMDLLNHDATISAVLDDAVTRAYARAITAPIIPEFAASAVEAMQLSSIGFDLDERLAPSSAHRQCTIDLFKIAITESASSALRVFQIEKAVRVVSYLHTTEAVHEMMAAVWMAINKHGCVSVGAYAVLATCLKRLYDKPATCDALGIACALESALLKQPPDIFAVLAFCGAPEYLESVRPGLRALTRKACNRAMNAAARNRDAFYELRELSYGITDIAGIGQLAGIMWVSLDMDWGLFKLLEVGVTWMVRANNSEYDDAFIWVQNALFTVCYVCQSRLLRLITSMTRPFSSRMCVLVRGLYTICPNGILGRGIEPRIASECINRDDVDGLIRLIDRTVRWDALRDACISAIGSHVCTEPNCPPCKVKRFIDSHPSQKHHH